MSLARRVIGGTGVVTLAGVVARALSLITVPILSRLLGPEPYGIAALVGTTVSLGATLGLLGIDMAYARFFFQEEPTRRDEVERFCWRFAAIGALISAVVAGCGWYWFGHRWVAGHRAVAGYAAPAILSLVAVTMATTRIRLSGNYRRVALALVCAAISSSVVSVGVALSWRADVWALLLGPIVGSMTTLLILGVPRSVRLLTTSRLPAATRRAVVSLGIAGSVTAPMYWLIASADRWFIAAYGNPSDIGIYSMAANLAVLGQMLNSALTLAWFPEASRVYGEHRSDALAPLGRLWSRLVVGLALVWVAVSAAGGDMLRLLAAPTFHAGAQYIPWLAGGVFFYGLSSLANTSLFLAGRMRYTAYLWLAGGGLSLAVNLLLVPLLGAYGAAMAQCVSYGLIAVAVGTVSQRILRLAIPWRRLAATLLLALTSGVLMSPAWAAFPVRSLLYKLPVGLVVAALLLRMVAPDWFFRAFARALGRT